MKRAAVVIAVLVLGPAGCGGDPSPEEQRKALAEWAQKADDACRRGAEEAQQRARVESLPEATRSAANAAADAARVVRSLRARIPEDGGRLAAPVRADADELVAQLAPMRSELEGGDRNAAEQRIDDIRTASQDWEAHATAAGLGYCLTPAHVEGMLDAVRAPLFAKDFLDLDHEVRVRLGRLIGRAPRSAAEVATQLQAAHPVLQEATERIGATNPPRSVTRETRRYTLALEALTADVADYLDSVEERRPAEIRNALAAVRRSARRWDPRTADLLAALRRIVAVPAPGQEA